MAKPNKPDPNERVVAENRKARFNYEILDTVEAGIQLQGTEVKSLRDGRSNVADAYASDTNGELWLYNFHIPEYQKAMTLLNHELRRPRKLLLRRSELNKMIGSIQKEGLTIVPLRVYFNARGMAKVLVALAKGKKNHDKRETSKQRDWQRDKQRLLRDKG
ncbi:SsrA-binding protein SmpB [Acuticoccus sp. MNP-M23]|uniref:SsrA-binding protein SmpB n=1 Tax=Acuticoccus sp. MNP-M23 TaxID=3072793 RepID=UPI00281556CC|nr:SsrA-binding protein SmpB [Acuticoccus sp. MNP-M23]WMS43413.1 SsrA-binding protein SmpB [Acuticoccus sp. MNP-M23]